MPKPKLTAAPDGGAFFAPPSGPERFPTGSTLLDCVTGGGWAVGRVINVVGDSSSGKTALATEACATYMKKFPGAPIFYRDVERRFEKDYAASLGIDVSAIDFGKDDEEFLTVEDVLTDIQDRLKDLPQGGRVLYVVDSLDALSDRDELAREIDKGSYDAKKPKLMSKLFRMVNQQTTDVGLTLFIVSQVRDNMNAGFGKKWTRSGGRALQFYGSQIILLSHMKRLMRTSRGVERAIGAVIEAKADKMSVGMPFRSCQFPLVFGFGVDDVSSMASWLLEVGRVRDVSDASEAEIKKLVAGSFTMDAAEWKAWRKKLRPVVRRAWADIEADFAPKKRKY